MTSHERAVEVDTALADLWGRQQKAFAEIDQIVESLHSSDGQRRGWDRRGWTVSDEDTEASVRAKLADVHSDFYFSHPTINDGKPYLDHTGKYAKARIDDLDFNRALIPALRAEAAPLEDEYDRDPWQRFFLVLNTGGHVHKTRSCTTTFPTTQWAWLPSLSGLTEDAAVADQGPRLCSVCYPSAPVEWTMGLPKAPRCEGSGKRPAPGHERRSSQPCSVCGRFYPVSINTGVIRAHKPQEA